jgi:hypothetical protein
MPRGIIIRTAQTDSVGGVVAELAGLAAQVRSSTYMGGLPEIFVITSGLRRSGNLAWYLGQWLWLDSHLPTQWSFRIEFRSFNCEEAL